MRPLWQELRTPFFVILFIFLFLFIYTKLLGPIPFSVSNINSGRSDVFRIDAQGEATGVPNTAVLSIGMTSQAATILAAQRRTNKVINDLVAEAKKLGIPEKDIKTINYSAYPDFSEGSPQPKPLIKESPLGPDSVILPEISTPAPQTTSPRSYTVTQIVEIKVKDLGKVNTILDTATKLGANQIGNVTFTFDDETKKKLEAQARDDAIKEAKEKAESLSKAAGLSIGRIVDISSYPVYGYGGGYQAETIVDKRLDTEVSPGQSTISVNVNIGYEIR